MNKNTLLNKVGDHSRQGDILPIRIEKLPKGLKNKGNNVLVHSDSTMHDHTLVTGTVFIDKEGRLFVDAKTDTKIVHTEDHNPIDLPKGIYEIRRQREYTNQDATRIVID